VRLLVGRGGIEFMAVMDPAETSARPLGVVGEAECLPFAAGSFDLIVSNLALHWVNDLPGALIQLRAALRPDGFFLATLLGGETLAELRRALMEAELEEEGGAGPRVSPFADLRDLGGLLQRAGFALPVVESDRLSVTYADAFALMRDLRAMGETNAVLERRKAFTRRATLARAAALYRSLYAGPDGRIPATFELVTLTAWAPHESQPKPLRPGSAAQRLAAALGSEERPAGEKATP
jgi:SAM-dependent methyltransferase